MADVSYISGPANSGKTQLVIKRAIEALQSGERVHFLLPSVNHIDYIKRSILKSVGKTYPAQLFLGTYVAWANKILDAAKMNILPITRGEEWIIIFNILRRNKNWEYLTKPGIVSLLQEIFNDFRNCGREIDRLMDLFQQDKFSRSINWLDIYVRLREIQSEYNIGTTSEQILRAVEILSNNYDLLQGKLLIVDGFYEFIPIQTKFLRLLADNFESVIVSLTYSEGHSAYSYCSDLAGFLDNGKTITASRHPAAVIDMEVIQSNLFNCHPGKTIRKETELFPEWINNWKDASVKILQCPSRRSEIEAAARVVKRWVLGGTDLQNIAVLYRGSYDYSSLVSLIFPQFGIPVKCSKNGKLIETEPARLVMRILKVNSSNYSRQSVIDLLRSESIRKYYGEDILQDIEYLSSEWGIPSSKNDWLDQFERRLEFLKKISSSDYEDFDISSKKIDRQVKKMEYVAPVLKNLLSDMNFPDRAKWLEFECLVYDLLKCYFPIEQYPGFREQIQIIKKVCRRMTRISDPMEVISLDYFTLSLWRMLESISTGNTGSNSEEGISVSRIMDIRGKAFDAVILVGMIDGEFPAMRRENPLFDNTERKRFNSLAGENLFSQTGANYSEDKLLLYLTLSSVHRKFLITYPESGLNGQPLAVSPFIDEIRKCFRVSDEIKDIPIEVIPASDILPEIENLASDEDVKLAFMSSDWNDEDKSFFKSSLKLGEVDDISRKSDIEKERKKNSLSSWCGNLSDDGPFVEFVNKPFSVTRIQDFAWCPFLYLCKHIWEIVSPEEPALDLTPLSEGLIIHKALQNFVAPFVSSARLSWEEFLEEKIVEKIDSVISGLSKDYRQQFRFISAGIWSKRFEDVRRGMESFVETELDYVGSGFYPKFLEKRFSISLENLSVSVNNISYPVRFTGKIDRVDRNDLEGEFLIIEYKRSGSSAHDPRKGVEDGIYFQLPLYIIAVEKIFGEMRPSGAITYAFRDGKRMHTMSIRKLVNRQRIISDEELSSILELARSKIAKNITSLASGKFVLNPFNYDKCSSKKCPYFDLCRIKTDIIRSVREANEDQRD